MHNRDFIFKMYIKMNLYHRIKILYYVPLLFTFFGGPDDLKYIVIVEILRILGRYSLLLWILYWRSSGH